MTEGANPGIYAEAFSHYVGEYGYDAAELYIPQFIKAAAGG